MNESQRATEKLVALVKVNSKHSDYQLLHPSISAAVGETYQPAGKHEAERQAYMQENLPFPGSRVLDIGANTGYFSFGALQAGAIHITAVEGNSQHANFIAEAVRSLGVEQRLEVCQKYFDFTATDADEFDIVLCLNVLHHLGDDFGDQGMALEGAKDEMAESLGRLARSCRWMWFQLGFNWKGDRHRPLFAHGRKTELIDFVSSACDREWAIDKVAIFNPETGAYEDSRDELLARFDGAGEFLNRPLFLLRSLTSEK